MEASELLRRIQSNNAPFIIDARTPMEFKRGHIPGSINAPSIKILLKMETQLPQDKNAELVVYCEHGQRGTLAKKLLESKGYHNATLLAGHLMDWKKAGLPLEK
jgi:rhodanese-related sulfurtransferase